MKIKKLNKKRTILDIFCISCRKRIMKKNMKIYFICICSSMEVRTINEAILCFGRRLGSFFSIFAFNNCALVLSSTLVCYDNRKKRSNEKYALGGEKARTPRLSV